MKKPFDPKDTPLPQLHFEKKFDVSYPTIWRYRKAGLEAIVVGGKVFIRESDFVAFLERMNGKTVSAGNKGEAQNEH